MYSIPYLPYLVYFVFIVYQYTYQCLDFFDPNSRINFYYFLMREFDLWIFLTTYFSAFMKSVLNFLMVIPLSLFILRRNWLDPEYWKILFAFKVIFDFTGHSYELNELISYYYYTDFAFHTWAFYIYVIAKIGVHIPAYWFVYAYAFEHDKLMAQPKPKWI